MRQAERRWHAGSGIQAGIEVGHGNRNRSLVRNSHRRLAKSAVAALVWALLTTPLTTLSLLHLADRPGTALGEFARRLPPWGAPTVVGFCLIGLPLVGVLLALVARTRIRSSWTPRPGGGYASAALAVGLLSAAAGAAIFVLGLFS